MKLGKTYLDKGAELFVPLKYISIQKRFTFIDLFSGIGGFRIPLEELGGKCLGYSEIDSDCLQVYQKNFISYFNQDEVNLGNVMTLSQLPFEIDIIVGGVPCQPWSIAGKIQGFDDPRGKLWFDVMRIIQENQPKGFIFENVKGLTEPRHQKSFEYILKSFQTAGYTVKAKVLNSYDCGLSQDRDRVFIVGVKKQLEQDKTFEFPQPIGTQPKLYQFIEGIQPSEIEKKKFPPEILFKGKIPVSRGRFQKDDELNDFFTFTDIRDGHTTIHSWDLVKTSMREKLICQTLLKNRRKKKYGSKDGNPLSLEVLTQLIPNLQPQEIDNLVQKKILRSIQGKGYDFVNSKISTGINGISKVYLPHSDVIATLTATGTKDFVAKKSIACQEPSEYKRTFIREIYRKRKLQALSAQDYARLQGFPHWFVSAEDENTAKKQFGNAVSVPVVYHLAIELLKVIF